MKKPLYMESTEIPPARTAQEIQVVLVGAGARQIMTEYDAAGKVTGLKWTMATPLGDRLFDMPARVKPLYEILLKRARVSGQRFDLAKLQAKAERVAWRQLLRWVQAQVAMIETGMVQASEVFFPYMVAVEGRTVYSLFEARQLPMLPAPEKPQ
jgi:hypothetical protein